MRDTGIGIEPETIQRIFDPFEQGDRSFQTRFGGLGLGLAISKSLAEAHGGTLLARSEGRRQAVPPSSSPSRHTGSRRSDRSPSRPIANRDAARFAFCWWTIIRIPAPPWNVFWFAAGIWSPPFAACVRPWKPPAGINSILLISDIALPDGTGVELMSCLRAISNIRGIAISGFGMNGDIEKSLQAGFAEHLVKPIKVEKLEAAIERAVGA